MLVHRESLYLFQRQITVLDRVRILAPLPFHGEHMKTEIVTDLPMGILLMVISQFFLLGVFQFINTNSWYTIVGTVICSVLYWRFFQTGFKVAFLGIEVDVEE